MLQLNLKNNLVKMKNNLSYFEFFLIFDAFIYKKLLEIFEIFLNIIIKK